MILEGGRAEEAENVWLIKNWELIKDSTYCLLSLFPFLWQLLKVSFGLVFCYFFLSFSSFCSYYSITTITLYKLIVPNKSSWQEKGIKDIQIGEKVRQFLFTDDMICYLKNKTKNLKDSTKNCYNLQKIKGYKIRILRE